MGTKRALIIDDEQDIREYEEALLADAGWQVETASSGDEGLERAKQSPPDVILLDIMMPERGGLSTLIAIRKSPELADVKVVLVTGVQEFLTQDYKAFLDRFKRHNPDGFIEKPFEPAHLLKTIDELVAG